MTKRLMQLMVFLVLAAGLGSPLFAADGPPIVVGRITHVEEDLLRYVPEENDWVAAVRDVPFAEGDTFYSGDQGRAELVVPNGTWARIGSATQIQYIALDPDYAEADVAAGLVRFYNEGGNTAVKADSPFGYVLSYPGSVFDFYVGENSVEVVAVKGTVSFVHAGTNARYDVSAGYPSILADRTQVASGESGVDPDWDAWNVRRDRFWAEKAGERGLSYRYLPPSLQSDAYVLEENGKWERVFYERRECWFWRPTHVPYGWAPFTVGRWTEWYGDQTWIPAEPFGYITHHYGNWVLVGDRWYWAPPVVSPGLPLLAVGFAWYPGRVCWIHSDGYVGWVPLAPRETYYCYHAWGGPLAVVVAEINIGRINIGVRNYAYAGHAVVVNQNNFYGVNNYRNVQVTNISTTTIINNYHAAPVVNNTVINNYPNMRQKYSYANVTVNEKPHASVVNRIEQNQQIVREAGKANRAAVTGEVKNIPQGSISGGARVQQPKMTNYIVPASDVNRPKSQMILQQRDVKAAGKEAGLREGQPGPGQTGRPGGVTNAPASPQPAPQASKPQGATPSGAPARLPQREGTVQPRETGQQPLKPQVPGSAKAGQGPPSPAPVPGLSASKPPSPRQQAGPVTGPQQGREQSPPPPSPRPGTLPTKEAPPPKAAGSQRQAEPTPAPKPAPQPLPQARPAPQPLPPQVQAKPAPQALPPAQPKPAPQQSRPQVQAKPPAPQPAAPPAQPKPAPPQVQAKPAPQKGEKEGAKPGEKGASNEEKEQEKGQKEAR